MQGRELWFCWRGTSSSFHLHNNGGLAPDATSNSLLWSNCLWGCSYKTGNRPVPVLPEGGNEYYTGQALSASSSWTPGLLLSSKQRLWVDRRGVVFTCPCQVLCQKRFPYNPTTRYVRRVHTYVPSFQLFYNYQELESYSWKMQLWYWTNSSHWPTFRTNLE